MPERLITTYVMKMESPGCTPGAPWWSAKISLDDDISEVLPYLNAELDETDYHHKEKVLLWDSNKGILYAFRPREIAIAPIEDRDTAEVLCHEIIDRVCDIWNRRHEIEPDYTGKAPPPSMLQLLKLLPGTNCKDCGYTTCMAFAAELIQKRAELSQCPHLTQSQLAQLALILYME